MSTLCMYCSRKDCTMSCDEHCEFYLPPNYLDEYLEQKPWRNRRERRAYERKMNKNISSNHGTKKSII